MNGLFQTIKKNRVISAIFLIILFFCSYLYREYFLINRYSITKIRWHSEIKLSKFVLTQKDGPCNSVPKEAKIIKRYTKDNSEIPMKVRRVCQPIVKNVAGRKVESESCHDQEYPDTRYRAPRRYCLWESLALTDVESLHEEGENKQPRMPKSNHPKSIKQPKLGDIISKKPSINLIVEMHNNWQNETIICNLSEDEATWQRTQIGDIVYRNSNDYRSFNFYEKLVYFCERNR